MASKHHISQIRAGLDIPGEFDEANLSFSFELGEIQASRSEHRPSSSHGQQKSFLDEVILTEPYTRRAPRSSRIQSGDTRSELQSRDDQEKNSFSVGRKAMTDDGTKNTIFRNVTLSKLDREDSVSFEAGSTTRRELKTMKTKKIIEKKSTYFIQDSEQDPLRVKEYDVVFRYGQFIEFFFYHVLFFLFGPLSIIILYPIAGKNLTKNMGFIGLNINFLIQTVQWILMFSSTLLWRYTDSGSITSAEIYMMFSALFLRICIIASKYGSMHPVRIHLLRSKSLPYRKLTQDYFLYRWLDQTDDIIEQELIAAIKRREVDSALFFFSFITSPDEKTRNKLTANRTSAAQMSAKFLAKEFLRAQSITSPQEPKKVDTSKVNLSGSNENSLDYSKIIEPKMDDLIGSATLAKKKRLRLRKKANLLTVTLENLEAIKMLSGVNLAREILHESKTQGIPRIRVIAAVIGIVRAFIPFFDRIINGDLPMGETAFQVCICLMFMVCNTYLFSLNFAFVLAILSDHMKKFYLMTQLSTLLSVRKLEEYQSKKIYPTINMFDPLSLRTWINLRMIFMDYGKKYLLRMNTNISIIIFMYGLVLLILILQVFGIMNIITDNLLSSEFLFEVTLVVAVMIRSVIVGANINDHFRVHRNIIQKNKNVASDLLQLDDVYFPVDTNNGFRTANIIYHEGIAKIRFLLKLSGFKEGSHEAARVIEDYLSKIVNFNDNAMQELEFEENNNPVRILGLVANMNMVRQIFVGVFSLAFAVLQKKLNL